MKNGKENDKFNLNQIDIWIFFIAGRLTDATSSSQGEHGSNSN